MAAKKNKYLESNRVKSLATDLASHDTKKPGDWSGGTYGKSMEDAMQKVLNREKFQYDLNGDALYQQYKDRYMQQGKQAMMDTMGQAAALTGGYGNSYAQTVGQQTYQGYLQGLNDKVPELYQLALDRYNQEGTDLLNQYGLLSDQYEKEYGRYRDDVGDWQNQRDYLANLYNNERNFDYTGYRDRVSDEQWQKNFDEALRQYNESLAEQKRQYNETLAENKRQFNAQQAAAAAARAASARSSSSRSSGGATKKSSKITVTKNKNKESAAGGGVTSFSNIQQTIRGHMMSGHPEKAEQLIASVWNQLDANQKKDIENMGFKIG